MSGAPPPGYHQPPAAQQQQQRSQQHQLSMQQHQAAVEAAQRQHAAASLRHQMATNPAARTPENEERLRQLEQHRPAPPPPQPYANPALPTRALEASGPALLRRPPPPSLASVLPLSSQLAARKGKRQGGGPGGTGRLADPNAGPPSGGSLPESELFRSLRDVERRLDAAIASRAGFLRDALSVSSLTASSSGSSSANGTRRLRVYARVDVEPGDEDGSGGGGATAAAAAGARAAAPPPATANPPRWVLTLWGRVMSVAEAEGIERGNASKRARKDGDGDGEKAAPPPPDPFLAAGNPAAPPPPRLKPFLSHVRKLRIELNKVVRGAGDGGTGVPPSVLTWSRTSHEGGPRDLKDKVTVRRSWDRKGDEEEEYEATITLDVDGVAERVTADAALAAAVAVPPPTGDSSSSPPPIPDTRAGLLRALWSSIMRQGLYSRDEPGVVSLDPGTPLHAVFGGGASTTRVSAGAVPAAVAAHVRALPTPSFVVRIRPHEQVRRAKEGATSGSARAVPVTTVHDFELDASAPTLPSTAAAVAPSSAPDQPSVSTLAERLLSGGRGDPAVEAADAALSSALRRLREHSRRRAFLLGFASSPSAFIRALSAAQARELRTARGPAASQAGALGGAGMRRSDVFSGSWCDEAAARLLSRAMAGGGS